MKSEIVLVETCL